ATDNEQDENGHYKDVEVMEILESDDDRVVNKNPGKDLDHFFAPPTVPTGSDKKGREAMSSADYEFGQPAHHTLSASCCKP
ncbi:hypothetical protein C0991_000884, partial [Blastosporella zonata]